MQRIAPENLTILDTGIRSVRNVLRYTLGYGCLRDLHEILSQRKKQSDDYAVIFIDEYFYSKQDILNVIQIKPLDLPIFVSTAEEPTTEYVDALVDNLLFILGDRYNNFF